jgi:hypothetical protein
MDRNGNPPLELDAKTAQLLVRLARTWGVSEQEAVRRAVAEANAVTASPDKQSQLAAFKALQRNLKLTSAKAAEWQDAVRESRR